MKNKIKNTSKKYIVVPIMVIGLVAILSFSSVDEVNASSSSRSRSRGNFAQAFAEKFNLNEDEVKIAMSEFHQQNMLTREQEMESRLEERLSQAVSDEKITQTQMYAILEKHEEMHDRMQELRDQDLSPDEMHELRADIHEEMQAWAEEQGIDYESFMRIGDGMMGRGGKGMMR